MYYGYDSFQEPDGSDEKDKLKQTLRKHNNELNNPCVKEQMIAFKCLDTNSYEQDKCKVHFENYKICKNFWAHVRAERRKLGILPHLPPPEEREKVKAEYSHLLR